MTTNGSWECGKCSLQSYSLLLLFLRRVVAISAGASRTPLAWGAGTPSSSQNTPGVAEEAIAPLARPASAWQATSTDLLAAAERARTRTKAKALASRRLLAPACTELYRHFWLRLSAQRWFVWRRRLSACSGLTGALFCGHPFWTVESRTYVLQRSLVQVLLLVLIPLPDRLPSLYRMPFLCTLIVAMGC